MGLAELSEKEFLLEVWYLWLRFNLKTTPRCKVIPPRAGFEQEESKNQSYGNGETKTPGHDAETGQLSKRVRRYLGQRNTKLVLQLGIYVWRGRGNPPRRESSYIVMKPARGEQALSSGRGTATTTEGEKWNSWAIFWIFGPSRHEEYVETLPLTPAPRYVAKGTTK